MTPLLPLILAFAALPVRAQFTAAELDVAADDPAAFVIDEDSVRLENLGPAAAPAAIAPAAGEDDPFPVLDRIVNLGERIWKIIHDNRPVVDVDTRYATALPEGVRRWDALAGWKPPEGTIYGFTAKNAYGATVVDVRYQVVRTHGGSYDGRGLYLTAVAVEPLKVEVAWGYRVSVEASVPDVGVVNAGTAENPIAGMTARIAWRIRTPIKDSQGTGLYYLQGDGLFRELGGPFASGKETLP